MGIVTGRRGYQKRAELASWAIQSMKRAQFASVQQGMYNGGQSLLVATNERLVFINKGMIYGLTVEDFSNDKITSIQHETGMMFGTVTIFASGNKVTVKQIQPKERARAFAEGVRDSLAKASAVVFVEPAAALRYSMRKTVVSNTLNWSRRHV